MPVRADSSDEELPPPAALFKRAFATPSAASTSSRAPEDTPAKRVGPPLQDAVLSVVSASDLTPAAPRRSPRRPTIASPAAPPVPSRSRSPAPFIVKKDTGEADEQERHRRLAAELFPPSPPSAAPAPPAPAQRDPLVSPPSSSLADAVRESTSVREISPEIISDSEVERAAASPVVPKQLNRRVRETRRTSSAVYDLSDSSDDDGGLARRMQQLGFSEPTPKKRLVKITPAGPSAFSPPPSLTASAQPRSAPISPSTASVPPARPRARTESPTKPASGAGEKKAGVSGLRREIDLTGSSSEDDERASLPLALIRELDRSVFRCTWDGTRRVRDGGGQGLPDGIEVVWNKRLRNTAGRASWKSTRTSLPGPPGSPPVRTQTHRATVELSTHVTDTEEKLKHTLAHELCHLAAWALSGEMKPPHGAAFKLWAKRVMLVRPDIEVTTTHSYEIAYRFRWQCVSATCGKIFGRHSNSVNPATHGCPCGARLVALDKDGVAKPAPAAGSAETPRKKSKWQEFMQVESPRVRRDNPGLPQSEVLKLVAERWRVAKLASASSGAAEAAGVEDSLAALSLS
ncbi:hypothetical protein JCM10450v2_001459 [Rhodotorula kratochvilovae]